MIISTRVKRGAIRTHLLIRKAIKNYNTPQVKRSVRVARAATFGFIAFRMATLPIPVSQTAYAADASVNSEPPSMQRINGSVIDAVSLVPAPSAQPVVVASTALSSVQVGKSLATENEEKAAKEAAEAKKRAAAIKAAQKAFAAPIVINTSGNEVAEMVRKAAAEKFGAEQAQAAVNICMRESGCNPNSINKRSGAGGVWQALPATKMGGWELSNQISWGLNYIHARYGTPNNAWAFWLSHHWY